jgi:two-component sensor histidine kinase
MDIYNRKQQWKLLLFIFAIIIGVGSLWYTNQLVRDLSIEEQKKVKLWAEATKRLSDVSLDNQDLDFLIDVVTNNTTIPVMWIDANENLKGLRNLDSLRSQNPEYLKNQLEKMKSENEPIPMDLGEGNIDNIYYRDSYLLRQLRYYPFFQLGVILLFILVAYFAFSTARKAEQNQVWLGLSKETAHQLGTPTSSLLAWVELLKEKQPDNELIIELENDVNRLEIITERFSKIGSKPLLKNENIFDILNNTVSYLKKRTSDQVTFVLSSDQDLIQAPVNISLFVWVVENICKNAIDATEGKGTITISLKENVNNLHLDIHDTGKGIPKSKHKTIFKPGYTTKKRGWGLGLSLAKRIIESYHDGKIFVYQSDPQKGTTIRIVLKKML